MKQFIANIIIPMVIILLSLAGCQLAGLDLQESYQYDSSQKEANKDMNALEFIKSRPDLFSSLTEAINYTGLADEYIKTDRTFLLLTNHALSDETYIPSGTNVMGSYFSSNKVLNKNYNPADPGKGPQFFIPDSWDVYPVETVKQFLLYHIVKKEVTYKNSTPFTTFYESVGYKGLGDTTLVSFQYTPDRYVYLYINGFTGSRKNNLKPRTTNIECSNGVVHVLDDFIIPPTKANLVIYNIK